MICQLMKVIAIGMLTICSAIGMSYAQSRETTQSGNKAFVEVSKSGEYGWYLSAGRGADKPGFSIYVYDGDAGEFSSCDSNCRTSFPPFTIDRPEDFVLPDDFPVDLFPGEFGISGRCDDEKVQLTYDGQPLYYHMSDNEPGHTNGQNLFSVFHLINVPIFTTCNDGILNGNETEIDCGGACAPCQTAIKRCDEFGLLYLSDSVGLLYRRDDGWSGDWVFTCLDTDCHDSYVKDGYYLSRFDNLIPNSSVKLEFKIEDSGDQLLEDKTVIHNSENICYFKASCSDGIWNQDEESVDCGGVCPACPNCNDGIQNNDEQGIDCGGSECGVSCDVVCNGTPNPTAAVVTTDESYFGSNDGKIDLFFEDVAQRSGIEFSMDNGKNFVHSANDNSESYTITNVEPGIYEIWSRWEGGECEINLGKFDVDPGGYEETCSDGILNQDELRIDCGGTCPDCPSTPNGDFPLVKHPVPGLPTPVVGSPVKEYGFTFDIEDRAIALRLGYRLPDQYNQQGGPEVWEFWCSCNQINFYSAPFVDRKASIPAECKDKYYYFLRYKRQGPVNFDPETQWVYSTLFVEDENNPGARVDPESRPVREYHSANWMRFRHPHAHDGITEAIFDAQHNNSKLVDLDRYETTVTDGPGNVSFFFDLQGSEGQLINPLRIEALEKGEKPNEQPRFVYNTQTCCGDLFNYGNVISYELTAVAGKVSSQTYNTFQHYVVGEGFNAPVGDPRLNTAGHTSTQMVFADAGTHIKIDKSAVFTQHVTTLRTEEQVDDFLVGHHLFHGVDPEFLGSTILGDKLIGRQACGNCHFRDGRSSEVFGTPKGPRMAPPVYGSGLLQYIEGAEVGLTWDGSAAGVDEQTSNALLIDHGVDPDTSLSQHDLELLRHYTKFLTVPIRKRAAVASEDAVQGELLFHEVGCASCHQPTQKTRSDAPVELRDVYLRPYTDMKTHIVNGGAFRTPPLWGLGRNIEILEMNNKDLIFMHDGSAQSLQEAIQEHNGDASNVRSRYNALSEADKEKIIKFLETL